MSLALLRDVAELPDLIDGYAGRAGRPIRLDASVRTRLTLYTDYLYLLMLTEGPTRGYAGPGYEAFMGICVADSTTCSGRSEVPFVLERA